MPNLFNAYIALDHFNYSIFFMDESDLERLVSAYDKGQTDIFIMGEKHVLESLNTIKLYKHTDQSKDSDEILNRGDMTPFHSFNRGNGKVGLSPEGHSKIGVEVTRDYINGNYGELLGTKENGTMNKFNEQLAESTAYLNQFIQSHRKDFFEEMKEFQPKKGYPDFQHSSKIVQCMRDIYHAIDEDFSDLTIPNGFSTPELMIRSAEGFISHLQSHDSYFEEAIQQFVDEAEENEEDLSLPETLRIISINRRDTTEAFKLFVHMAKTEIAPIGTTVDSDTNLEKIERLIKRFPLVSKQLLKRRNEAGTPRTTLEIKDEYDVQDLFHALLRIYFDDIRPEEWNPSYAGKSTRSDFLLKSEKIVIEVKKTRSNLKDKEVGEQLTIDIAHYRRSQDCDTLICFVHDPDGFIANPIGLQNDLKEISGEFKVHVFIE